MNITKIRLQRNEFTEVTGVFFEAEGKNCFDFLDWVDVDIAHDIDSDLTVTQSEYIELCGFNNVKSHELETEYLVKPFEDMSDSELEMIIRKSIADADDDISIFHDLYKGQVRTRAISIGLASLRSSLNRIGQ